MLPSAGDLHLLHHRWVHCSVDGDNMRGFGMSGKVVSTSGFRKNRCVAGKRKSSKVECLETTMAAYVDSESYSVGL